MPMTVITLTKVPNSLRGDLTKWLQEVATGVYVGNINTRIREEVWERIITNIKDGEATMSYAKRNEIGYDFVTHNTKREVIYFDGLPLVFLPKDLESSNTTKMGFSNAAKKQQIKKVQKNRRINKKIVNHNFVVIDVETTGLDPNNDQLIEVAAIKKEGDKIIIFNELIRTELKLKNEIIELTGITNKMLDKDGKNIDQVLEELINFIEDATLIGFNIKFDLGFINAERIRKKQSILKNKNICLLQEVKRKEKLLRNYKLDTVLKKYGIKTEGLHRALVDAEAEYELAIKLNIF